MPDATAGLKVAHRVRSGVHGVVVRGARQEAAPLVERAGHPWGVAAVRDPHAVVLGRHDEVAGAVVLGIGLVFGAPAIVDEMIAAVGS